MTYNLIGAKQIVDELDKSNPRWFLEWADAQDFRDAPNVEGLAHPFLKERVANRMFHPIINAALAAGVVKS